MKAKMILPARPTRQSQKDVGAGKEGKWVNRSRVHDGGRVVEEGEGEAAKSATVEWKAEGLIRKGNKKTYEKGLDRSYVQ